MLIMAKLMYLLFLSLSLLLTHFSSSHCLTYKLGAGSSFFLSFLSLSSVRQHQVPTVLTWVFCSFSMKDLIGSSGLEGWAKIWPSWPVTEHPRPVALAAEWLLKVCFKTIISDKYVQSSQHTRCGVIVCGL